jgi:hypothetical protein
MLKHAHIWYKSVDSYLLQVLIYNRLLENVLYLRVLLPLQGLNLQIKGIYMHTGLEALYLPLSWCPLY